MGDASTHHDSKEQGSTVESRQGHNEAVRAVRSGTLEGKFPETNHSSALCGLGEDR